MVAKKPGSGPVVTELPQQAIYRVVVTPNKPDLDGYGRVLLRKTQQLGFENLTAVHTEQLFLLQGTLSLDEALYLAQLLLDDPVTESMQVELWTTGLSDQEELPAASQTVIETTYLPGVTDPPGDNLVRAAGPLGINGLQNAATGSRFTLEGGIDNDHARAVASAGWPK